MSHYLVLLLLAPLLTLQGLYVRRTSLVLPEAAGERAGSIGKGEKLNVLIAGDSAAAGVGVDKQDSALTGYLTRELAKDHYVIWALIAKSGSNTQDLIKHLSKVKGDKFDVVLLSLGVNDVLTPLSASKWQGQLGRLTQVLHHDFGAKQVWFTSVPPMERFPLLPQPLRWFLGRRAQEFNRVLASYVEQAECCGLVDLSVHLPKQEPDSIKSAKFSAMAADGFHPDESLYQLWGNSAANMIGKQIKSNRLV
ncbi:SGNH/GDSL hydrolase family protein [Shewanella woodyi]|uniref:SGNH/GDSL hydrolase family protein n=1 Tax=Shewanella woodyi TaxID=60961 RepID=UPI0037491F00